MSDRPRNKPQQKQNRQLLAVVFWNLVSLVMQLSIDNKNYSLPLCVYVAAFGKSGHTCSFIYVHNFMCNYTSVGYLCGKCHDNTGVSALLNKCVSCGNVNVLLIIALGMSIISYKAKYFTEELSSY